MGGPTAKRPGGRTGPTNCTSPVDLAVLVELVAGIRRHYYRMLGITSRWCCCGLPSTIVVLEVVERVPRTREEYFARQQDWYEVACCN